MKIPSFALITFFIISGYALADDYVNPEFTAVCDESSARTYMSATDANK